MRAVACLMVLVHHLVLRMNFYKIPPALDMTFIIARFGNHGVSVFFVLSGFLLSRPFWLALDRAQPLPSLRIYTMRRAARILPGFWFALTVGFAISFTVYGFPLDAELVGRYIAGFFLMSQWHWRTFFPVQGDGPLWSIPFETTCYVLLPIGFLLLFNAKLRSRSVFVNRLLWIGIIAISLVGHWLVVTYLPTDSAGRGWQYSFQGGAKEWMPRYNPIGFFAIFAIGVLAAGVQTIVPARRSVIYDIIGALAIVMGAWQLPQSIGGPGEGYAWLGIPYQFPLLPLAVAAALCTLPQSRLLARLLDNSLSRYIATVSFGVYVWQDIVLTMMQKLMPWTFGTGSDDVLGGWITSSLVATAIIFAIGTLSYVLLERPVMRWARTRENRMTRPAIA
ncbi:Peptidoglycan/LPS O-acetylase OafA/YrhL, contains acyltransferase and SGNH-hydrolase domains [Rhizobium miluonense]|uniref:Peptidoglycan/LPS O-acetylase OafA/YrhL, contains acyltransferase and SGNH-hydrolase domains n=2 Tax=Rhizobium miluonense TaxID=411945 RepID=A0A1C3VQT4_9HYPH|nr:Peptidoglycan/LPS O-acetylase OafA/YrhL, contains acyltransferase and SGNH-hydrolase domains [Rhizobium miluonense]